jgi:hypothetical protein
MLKCHNVSVLEGKVATNLLDSYKVDYKNSLIASIIAGFHRSYGLRNEGISMALEIVSNIKDDTESINDRNILVWNLYILSGEFIDEGLYDEAINFTKRAEKNWSRDVVLGDEIGVYHVSWLEQIWQRQAEISLLIDDKRKFELLTDKIIASRNDFYSKAEEITGETSMKDRCTYNCLELLAFGYRKYDIQKALETIKQAITLKLGTYQKGEMKIINQYVNEDKAKLYNHFGQCLKYYYSIHEQPYDNISYSYCKSCKYFIDNKKCNKLDLELEEYKCCAKYRN